MKLLKWLFRRNGSSIKIEEPPIRLSELRRRSTQELEAAKQDVAEGVAALQESSRSLDATLEAILLIRQETRAILMTSAVGYGPKDGDDNGKGT